MGAVSHLHSLVQTSALLIWMSVWGLQEQNLPGPHLISSILPCKESADLTLCRPLPKRDHPHPHAHFHPEEVKGLFLFSFFFISSEIFNEK